MNSSVSASFRKAFAELPSEIQDWAIKDFSIWQRNPRHPSLQFKKVGRYWSVRVGEHYRALGVLRGDTLRWFWIGAHDEYQRLIDTQ